MRILLGIAVALLASLPATVRADDPCADPAACCVDPATCVITDKVTLAGLTVDKVLSCPFTFGTYVTGGNAATGVVPAPGNQCGLSFQTDSPFIDPGVALNTLDHHWLQSSVTPKVVDFGAPVNSAFVFVAVDHGPFPEEGIESTVWGSNSSDISTFPTGWTRATLTTIWKRGWEDPVECQGQDNSDDFVGQYSFPGTGFRFLAVHANFSISIFNDASHTSWESAGDDSGVPGWQSAEDETDAVGTPTCDGNAVIAEAGPDQTGTVGGQVCFDGSNSTGVGGIATFGWDLTGDGVVDATGPTACRPCTQAESGTVTLFVTNACGCVASDTAHFTCKPANQPPVAKCKDVAVAADLQCHGAADVNDGSFDPDGDPITLAQSPAGPYGLGPNSVTLTVTDSKGASASCTATVTVVDRTPPAVTCPGPLSASADASCHAPVPGVPSVTAVDNCTPGGALVVLQSPPAGTSVGFGVQPILVTVTDAAGNTGNCSTTFTVKDTSAPTVTSAVASADLWPPNHNLVNVGLTASSGDNCTASPAVHVAVFGDEDDETPTGDGTFSPDAKDIAPGTLRLRSERKGDADGRVYLIISSATDGSGNSGHSCATVVVPHSQSPADEASVAAQAAAAKAFCDANGTAPAGYFVVGDGPTIGPKQ
jgi:hypothetical protein